MCPLQVSSLVYHANGHTCYVSIVNSVLGLLMYSSYFVLFLQLFLNHYVYAKKAPKAAASDAQALAGAADAITKGKPTGAAPKASAKKI